jgi:predicted  nucleic acid-binding Zn-ribbon protein
MLDTKVQAERIVKLVEDGMSVRDASIVILEEIAEEFVPITNRVEWIKGLKTIQEVRKAVKVAQSKKSKAAEKNKSKFQDEIDAGNARLNALMAKANRAKDPLRTMLDMGEDPSKVLHNWIRAKEQELKDDLSNLDLSVNKRKVLVADQATDTPQVVKDELNSYHPELVNLYEERVKRGDQGVITINRKIRLMESIK